MNKKFISLCLLLISIVAILIAGGIAITSNNQPVYFGEEQILFPAPAMAPLEQKSFATTLFSELIPYAIIAAVAVVVILLIKKYINTFKKYWPKAICVLLCIVCLGSSVHLASTLAESSFTPVSPSEYFGRKQLEKMTNSDSLLYAYDQMVEGIENHASEISIKNTFHSLNKDEWEVALYTYLYDYPQHFWMGNSYRYSYSNGINGEIIMHKILPVYVFSAAELPAARETFNNEAQEILNSLSPSMNEYELEITLHDILCSRIVYQEADHAHTAYGGLVTNVAVCEGYGKAFQYLLNQVGIHSTLATGTGTPTGSGITENHAWNFVTINGQNYFVDVTWDDQNEPYYGYFNITTAMLQEDHALSGYPYPFPLCTATDDNYFFKNNKAVSSFSLNQIVELLRYNLTTHVYLTGSTSSFNQTVLSNSNAILNALDMVTSSNVSISSLGRERVITVIGQRRGDVNGDNILDQKDVALIQQYTEDSGAITDADCLKAADYNNDGKIDEKDSQKLSNYIQGLPDTSTSSVPVSSAPVSSAPVSSAPVSSVPVSSAPVSSTPVSSTPISSPTSSTIVPSQVSSIVSVPSDPSTPVSSTPTSSTNDSQPSTPDDTPTITLGDINQDGKANAKDALVVLRITVNKYIPTENEQAAADVTKDGVINAKDALEILKKSVGKPACF